MFLLAAFCFDLAFACPVAWVVAVGSVLAFACVFALAGFCGSAFGSAFGSALALALASLWGCATWTLPSGHLCLIPPRMPAQARDLGHEQCLCHRDHELRHPMSARHLNGGYNLQTLTKPPEN